MVASASFNLLRQQGQGSLSLPAGSYIYSLCRSGSDALAAISSDNSLRRFDRQTLKLLPDGVVTDVHSGSNGGVTCLCAVDGAISEAGPLLATSGRDGTVRLWDSRAMNHGAVSVFLTGNDKRPALLSLACNPAIYSIVAGSELVSAQAALSFWDLRSPGQPRMQYVESHNDDITELCYHPTRNDVLLSGSTDGLVSVYNTTIAEEDDALLQVINHGSIHHAGFIGDKAIYALSHDEVFSIHPFNDPDENIVEPAPIQFGDLRSALHCDYAVDILVDGGVYAAVGSTREQTLNLVPIVASPEFHFDQAKVWRLPGAHGEEIVRSMLLDSQSQTVFTCGEDGHVRLWREDSEMIIQSDTKSADEPKVKTRPDSQAQDGKHSRNKETRKEKRHKDKRYKPY
ncbi:WD repeat protein [Coccidioides immitis RS]|uniref:WD repeat protein n=4 Tax=Coccidioides immitis TaxID=5501 RepID=J3KAY4_COCIM|nr:WD repeat protein [Coccidioides immitis RS]EAS32227.3 WD repeat protein [Coccidioides immitis RS]KMP07437.1 hypothetical protein CIRG_07118 [Coccidioides immitis RMSCC 2394]KMU72108.1 WD repeat containing protein [Coccidioides immitis RMSCC 3703]KMU82518.1 WD repeat containing protein [Coccidioides immitis H538.4]